MEKITIKDLANMISKLARRVNELENIKIEKDNKPKPEEFYCIGDLFEIDNDKYVLNSVDFSHVCFNDICINGDRYVDYFYVNDMNNITRTEIDNALGIKTRWCRIYEVGKYTLEVKEK